jgi:hypothetical protein
MQKYFLSHSFREAGSALPASMLERRHAADFPDPASHTVSFRAAT